MQNSFSNLFIHWFTGHYMSTLPRRGVFSPILVLAGPHHIHWSRQFLFSFVWNDSSLCAVQIAKQKKNDHRLGASPEAMITGTNFTCTLESQISPPDEHNAHSWKFLFQLSAFDFPFDLRENTAFCGPCVRCEMGLYNHRILGWSGKAALCSICHIEMQFLPTDGRRELEWLVLAAEVAEISCESLIIPPPGTANCTASKPSRKISSVGMLFLRCLSSRLNVLFRSRSLSVVKTSHLGLFIQRRYQISEDPVTFWCSTKSLSGRSGIF